MNRIWWLYLTNGAASPVRLFDSREQFERAIGLVNRLGITYHAAAPDGDYITDSHEFERTLTAAHLS